MTVVATSAPPPHDVAMHGTAGLAADATTLVQARHHGLLQQEEIYIFGFGSLVHHPGFDHVEEERVVGFIRGYRRVFWQGSTDHRGVPGAPGRVVTLEPCADGVVWGVAYRLAGDRAQQLRTLQYLEWREKQYDVWAQVEVFTADSPDAPVAAAIAFIASSDRKRNPNYLGPAPLDDIAQQIATAHGPSGPNWQYVYKLADAMRDLGLDDPELFQLESAVRARLATLGGAAAPPVAGDEGGVEVEEAAAAAEEVVQQDGATRREG